MWTTWNPSTQQAGSCFVLVDFTKYLKFEFISTTWRSKGSNVSELSICMIINALLYFSSAIRRSTPNVTIYRSQVCCKPVLLKALVQFLNATQLNINATFPILFLVLAVPKISSTERVFFAFDNELYVWESKSKSFRGFFLLHKLTKDMLGLPTGADTPTALEVCFSVV